MPVGDWDGASGHDIKYVGDWDGTAGHIIKSIGDYDGMVGHPIWNREKTQDMNVSGLQDGQWHTYSVYAEVYTEVSVLSFSPAQSYGSATTRLEIFRGGYLVSTLRNLTRRYTGSYFQDTNNSPPQDRFVGLQRGDEIRLSFYATYDPNVSGQGTSRASATIKLS